MEETMCSHESEFGKMTPYCIDRLGPLTNHKIANAEHHCRGLLLFALCRYEPHGRPLGCFTDRFGVSQVRRSDFGFRQTLLTQSPADLMW
jgi:hypothetical protein